MRYFIECLEYESKTVPGRIERVYISRPLEPGRKRKRMSDCIRSTKKHHPEAVYTAEVVERNYE